MRRLLRETVWLKIYETDTHGTQYESKLLTGEAVIHAHDLMATWDDLPDEHKWEFALAFSAKPQLSSDDIVLLEFLFQKGDSMICSMVALQTVKHPNTEKAVEMIQDRIGKQKTAKANYFQALGLIGSPSSVRILEEAYHNFAELDSTRLASEDAVDLVACAEALWHLTNIQDYRIRLRSLMKHPIEGVRAAANLAFTRAGGPF